METRWLRWVGPGAMALLAIGVVASTATGAGQRPSALQACGEAAGMPANAARRSAPADLAEISSEPWFRLDAWLDRRGELQGQRLALGLAGERQVRSLDLPAEAFAAGPFGRTVLVGADDGTGSRLSLVDVDAGCAWQVGAEAAVIRRATVDPSGTILYEMRVDRTTRDDLGIWARPVDGSSAPVRVLDPLPADDRFGRTFSTELSWDLDGQQLVVQSCGEDACRTRLVDLAGGPVRMVADPDLGVLVGVAGDRLVTFRACPGQPCPIVRTNLVTGDRTILADDAGAAVLIATSDGPRVVHERLGPAGIGLRSVATDGAEDEDLHAVPANLRLHPDEVTSGAATIVPAGWVVLSPEGRLPDTGPAGHVELRHVPDGKSVQFEEVAR